MKAIHPFAIKNYKTKNQTKPLAVLRVRDAEGAEGGANQNERRYE